MPAIFWRANVLADRNAASPPDKIPAREIGDLAYWRALEGDVGKMVFAHPRGGISISSGAMSFKYFEDMLFDFAKSKGSLSKSQTIKYISGECRRSSAHLKILSVMGNFLARYDANIRYSEPVNSVYELAIRFGYIKNESLSAKGSIWRNLKEGDVREVLDFLRSLKECLSSSTFHDALRRRNEKIVRVKSSLNFMLDDISRKHKRFFILAYDFKIILEAPIFNWVSFKGYPGSTITTCRELLFEDMSRERKFDGENYGYIWRLDYCCESGPFIRLIFFVSSKLKACQQKFHESLKECWSGVVGPRGAVHSPREFADGVARYPTGAIDGTDSVATMKVRQYIDYLAIKEWHFRVVMPKGERTVGRSECLRNSPDTLRGRPVRSIEAYRF